MQKTSLRSRLKNIIPYVFNVPVILLVLFFTGVTWASITYDRIGCIIQNASTFEEIGKLCGKA
jgi:hypothetical protein